MGGFRPKQAAHAQVHLGAGRAGRTNPREAVPSSLSSRRLCPQQRSRSWAWGLAHRPRRPAGRECRGFWLCSSSPDRTGAFDALGRHEDGIGQTSTGSISPQPKVSQWLVSTRLGQEGALGHEQLLPGVALLEFLLLRMSRRRPARDISARARRCAPRPFPAGGMPRPAQPFAEDRPARIRPACSSTSGKRAHFAEARLFSARSWRRSCRRR